MEEKPCMSQACNNIHSASLQGGFLQLCFAVQRSQMILTVSVLFMGLNAEFYMRIHEGYLTIKVDELYEFP